MRTVVVRLTDPVMGDGDLHGVVEVVGGATSTFSGAADLLRQLRAVVEAPAGGAAIGGQGASDGAGAARRSPADVNRA